MSGGGFYAHPLALVESEQVGAGTRVWAWAHVMEGARLGSDCNVGEHCFIERGASLGDRVTVKNGVAVWEGVIAEDDVFIGPGAVLTNDLHPRSRAEGFTPTPTHLRKGCSIGANATILAGVSVGRYALVGAGAVVTADVPDFGLVTGNPGRLQGHVCACGRPLDFAHEAAGCSCGRTYERADGLVAEVG
ncbi:MAG: N-acetyltransferase [Acidimicrobiia bacterium]|nr:N-acetyltransferase [Acidimicrobiia bacterium]